MSEIRRGMCAGCPYDVGRPDTEAAYALGCLPGVSEVAQVCRENDTAWACHADPDKVCCGFAGAHKDRIGKPLERQKGVHSP